MAPSDTTTVTYLLAAVRAGDSGARERLVALIYDELRPLATGMMQGERTSHTLEPTALVHEAFLRLFQGDALGDISDRTHLMAVAAQAMRRILVDHARARTRQKRGAGAARVPLDDLLAVFEDTGVDLLDLNEALDVLAAMEERQHEFIQLNYFAGLTQAQIAELHHVSHTTVENELRAAKAWLKTRLSKGNNDEPGTTAY